jgi:hypothetical protein
MNIRKIMPLILSLFLSAWAEAQILYGDAIKGQDNAKGTQTEPLASLEKAVAVAAQSAGAVTIRLGPGLYLFHQALRIESQIGDTAEYILEATIMPDDKDWKPWLMPVIASVSLNNDHKYFDHCAGILVARENVSIRGIKFVGNPNPVVEYYYPIEKDTITLKNLEISQCYFIGDKNGAVVQGAVYAEGPGIHVDHCIFYGCKNAVLSFENIKDFAITNSIIYGAYECAVWYGAISEKGPEAPFIFKDNIVSHCSYFWAASSGHDLSYYTFDHSLICENDNYVGMQNGQGAVMPLPSKENFKETGVRKSGRIKLVEVKTEGLPPGYLNLSKESDGLDIGAGIFKIMKD